MSRQSKNARLRRERKGNGAGPAKTTPKHGKKRRAWANQPGLTRGPMRAGA
jgi:hypothetical protein